MSAVPLARKTILFSGHDLKFIRRFVAHCEKQVDYRVLVDEHSGHQITNPAKCRELLPAADIVFCEWCLGNAKWYSQHKQPGQRLLIRVHHQEMELPYRWELDWKNVDAIIFTNFPHYQRFCREQAEHRDKAVVIYCDVDCEALDQEKLPGAEFNLGLVGINPMRKRPDLALEILRKLRQKDSRYTLFFKTRMPWEYKWLWDRPHERDYFNDMFARIEASALRDSVVFDAHGEDMAQWYTKVGFLLSTSDHEGSHQAVAEGMASGCIPVIRNWTGASPLYPDKFIFSCVDEAVELIQEFRANRTYAAGTAAAKVYAQENFDDAAVFTKLKALFVGEPCREAGWTASKAQNHQPRPAVPGVTLLGYLPAGFRGGYRIRIEQAVKALARQGCDVHLACLHPETPGTATLEAHRAELARLGCKVSLIPFKGFFDVKLDESAMRGQLDLLEQALTQTKAPILQAEALYCARLGLLLKERRPDLRLVFDCHGTSPEEEQMGGAHPARVRTMREWERRALAEADLNVFVSQAMHDFYLKQYQFSSLPYVVVPCCVAEERFADPKQRPALSLPVDRPVLAYAGTLAAWQCGEEMIRLFAQIQAVDPAILFLLLVPQADHQQARERLAKHGIGEANVVLAELPHDQVAPTLRRAHAGMLLRRTHPVNQVSSPTKFGEYLAAGIPVIMTEGIGDFSGLADTKGIGLVLKPELLEQADLPAKEVRRILAFVRQSWGERREMANRCRTAAAEYLHWDRASATLLQAYRGVAGQTHGAPEIGRAGENGNKTPHPACRL